MSDDNGNGNIHATGTKPGTVHTDNIHATSEPLGTGNPLTADAATDGETGGESTDNIHATDETA
ncbi:hypothetical protein [Streptomyces sp. NPDC004065]|uniref:hypothetical protein n=1 Tax=Streptomyces sp. NPDC004065 TaxID=3364689 RepID=UPI00384D7258